MRLEVLAPDGVPEVSAGADLGRLLTDVLEVAEGDVVLVTSKVVSKAEGRLRRGGRGESLAAETARVVARRGALRVVRTRRGLVLAAAGIDESNVEQGHHLLLPEDPDASARGLRAALRRRTGRTVAVVVTDTAGRAWRSGQTDIAVGVAGLRPVEDLAGEQDPYGNRLRVTAAAVGDELAGASQLAQGKLGRRPFAVVRGRSDLVLPPGRHGPGAGDLVRAEAEDLFGLGARQAVVAAVTGADADAFGAPVPSAELAEVLSGLSGLSGALGVFGVLEVSVSVDPEGGLQAVTTQPAAVELVAFAHGWRSSRSPSAPGTPDPRAVRLRLRPLSP